MGYAKLVQYLIYIYVTVRLLTVDPFVNRSTGL